MMTYRVRVVRENHQLTKTLRSNQRYVKRLFFPTFRNQKDVKWHQYLVGSLESTFFMLSRPSQKLHANYQLLDRQVSIPAFCTEHCIDLR